MDPPRRRKIKKNNKKEGTSTERMSLNRGWLILHIAKFFNKVIILIEYYKLGRILNIVEIELHISDEQYVYMGA